MQIDKYAAAAKDGIVTSFGIWNTLSQFFTQLEFIHMQSLCRFTYDVGISRVQPSIHYDLRDLLFYTDSYFQPDSCIRYKTRH